MHSRQNRDWLFRQIDTRKDARAFRNTRQPQIKRLRRQVVEVQVDVVAIGTHTAPFTDFHCHAARHHIAGGEIFVGRRVPLHKPLTLGIGEVSTFATRTFSNQTARAVDPCWMELNKLHILQRQTLTRDHAAAVAGASVRGRGGEIGTAVTAGGQNGRLGVEDMHGAVIKLPRNNALTLPIIGHDQIGREIFDEELCLLLHRLPIKRVQDRVAGPVRRGTGPLHGRAFPKLCRVTAEGSLVDVALFRAGEGNAVMLQFINRLWRFTGEVFHRVRVAQPVRAFHSVIHVPLPAIRPHVAQGRRNAALCGNRVGACREHFGDAGRAQPLLRHAQRGAQTRTAGTYDNDVILMRLVFICFCHSDVPYSGNQRASLTKAKSPAAINV